MKKTFIQTALRPKTLTIEEREKLAQRLFVIHDQIFDGVSYAAFKRYVVEPESKETRIWPITNQAGQDVGYITCQVFEAELMEKGKKCSPLIYRTEVGLLPDYRGGNMTFRHLTWEFIKGFFLSGFRKSWFLATPVHPYPYKIACNRVAEVYPVPGKETPSHVLEIMDQLAGKLGISGTGQPFAKKVGWIVRNTPKQQESLRQSKDPFIQFYLEQNPGYVAGDGLMTLLPFKVKNGISSIQGMITRALRKGLNRGFSLSLPHKPLILQNRVNTLNNSDFL